MAGEVAKSQNFFAAWCVEFGAEARILVPGLKLYLDVRDLHSAIEHEPLNVGYSAGKPGISTIPVEMYRRPGL